MITNRRSPFWASGSRRADRQTTVGGLAIPGEVPSSRPSYSRWKILCLTTTMGATPAGALLDLGQAGDAPQAGGRTRYEFRRCTFQNNSASAGGALHLGLDNAIIDSCTFDSNRASKYDGGAIRAVPFSATCGLSTVRSQATGSPTRVARSTPPIGKRRSNTAPLPTIGESRSIVIGITHKRNRILSRR